MSRQDDHFHSIDIGLEKIAESYARFRLIQPHSDSSMFKSIRRLGQLSPAVVSGEDNDGCYEMIDGFKRLRALRSLKGETIRARVIDGHRRTHKAAMIQLNCEVHSMGTTEEALLVQSLHREDGLDQVEVAALLGRGKSWVSRRIALVEKLSEDVLEHLRLGLIRPTQGRELIRLPRGNQKAALDSVLKHSLTSRETRRLVSMLIDHPRWDHEKILWLPLEILDDRNLPRPPKESADDPFQAALAKLEKSCILVDHGIDKGLFLEIPQQQTSITKVVEETLNRIKNLALKGAF